MATKPPKPKKAPSQTSYDKRGNRVSSNSPSAVSSGSVSGGARAADPISGGSARTSSSSAGVTQVVPTPSSASARTSSGGQPKAPTISPPKSSYQGSSVVDYLGSTGAASDYASRSRLAQSYGISGYAGTADQNTRLLSSLRGGSSATDARSAALGGTVGSGARPSYDSGAALPDAAAARKANDAEAKRQKQEARDAERAQQKAYKRGALDPSGPDISNAGLIQQLLALQKRTYEQAQPLTDDLMLQRSRNQQQIANTLGSAGDESLQTGRAAIYQQSAAAQEAVKQKQIDQILANAASSAGMIGTGIGATSPVTQFGQLTNPQSGQVVGAGATGNNPMLERAVSNAVGIVRGGGSYSDALSSLSSFGAAGEQALLNALGASSGGVNPTLMNAQAGVTAGLGTAGGAAQVASLAEANRVIQQTEALKPAFDAELASVKQFASSGALSPNAGILSELRKAYQNTVGGETQVAQFLQKAKSIAAMYEQITGAPANLDEKLTVAQFNAQLAAMSSTIANKLLAAREYAARPTSTANYPGAGNTYSYNGATYTLPN